MPRKSLGGLLAPAHPPTPHGPLTPRALLRMTSDQRPQLLEVRLW